MTFKTCKEFQRRIEINQNIELSRFLIVSHRFKSKLEKKFFDPKIEKGPPFANFSKTHILVNIFRTLSPIVKISKDLNSTRQNTLNYILIFYYLM